MIQVDSLLYRIDQKLNKLSTNEHQQIQLEDKILALNEAQIRLIKQKVNGITESTKLLGFDSFRKRYDDLQNIVVDYTKLDLKESNKKLNQWSTDISKISPKYMLYIDAFVIASKGDCKDKMLWVNKDLIKHGDISLFLSNEHYKPSFEYRETFNTITDNYISVYTDGTFDLKELHLMYIRYPKYIDKEGYIKLDGNASKTQDCELVDYLEDELLDMAVKILAMYTENPSALQTAQERIINNE